MAVCLIVVSSWPVLLQELLGASKVVASGSVGQGAKAAKDKVKDKVEDVQEAWETSQVSETDAVHLADRDDAAGSATRYPCSHSFMWCRVLPSLHRSVHRSEHLNRLEVFTPGCGVYVNHKSVLSYNRFIISNVWYTVLC